MLPAPLIERAKAFARSSKSTATITAYKSDFRDFEGFCYSQGLESLPAEPQTVAVYLAARAGELKPSTLSRRLVAIKAAHKLSGHDFDSQHPAIRETLTGIKRTLGTARNERAPLLTKDLRRAVEAEPSMRNRAILLLGFAAALRRSEIVALDVGDLEFTDDGVVVSLRFRKTDQEGEGTKIGVPYGSNPMTCPVRTLKAYMDDMETGPLFVNRWGDRLSGRWVWMLVKNAVERIGMDPTQFGGHSLRAGLATSAAKAGASERSIMKQTGHKSLPMVRRYIRDGQLFTENAAAMAGL
jgi:site-specific recombinase XerD